MKTSRQAAERTALRATPAPDERPAVELELAGALLRGDRSAGAALWDHFSPLVRGLLGRAFGPGESVEDALQDIFLRIFHKGRTLRDPTCLRSFVVAVTVHFIRSELRKRKLRRAILMPFPRKDELPPEPAAAGGGGARLALAALYRALETLTVGERLAFSLRFFEDTPVGEAAAVSGMSLATFKRRLTSAKQKLWACAASDPWLSTYADSPSAMRLGGVQEEGES